MAPTTRSLKINPKKEEHNISPLKLDNELPHLLPKTTLPTKLPLTHSTNDILNFDGMDKEILQKQKNMLQYNKQKLQDFDLKYNSLNSTFKHFASENMTILSLFQTSLIKSKTTSQQITKIIKIT